VLQAGKASPGIYVVISGKIRITDCDSSGQELLVVEHGPGSFSGERPELSCARSFFDGVAVGETHTLEIVADRLRALLIGDSALGGKLMRAMILRARD
jgi:thioredoxin reductase (NADPH)